MTETPHRSPALVYGSIGVVMLIWALNYIATKTVLREMDALTLASFRITLAAAIMTPIFLLSTHKREVERADALKFTQLSLLGVVMNQMFFTTGLSMTTVSHSALLVGLGPIYVLLLAWFKGLESLVPQKIVGMLLAFAGVAVLGTEHGFNLKSGTLAGDLLTMCGSLAFSFYVVMAKQVARRYNSIEINFYLYLAAAALIVPVTMRQGALLDWGAVSWRAWVALGYTAAFASVAAYLIYFWALKHVTASRIAAFSYLLPVMATSFGILLLGERPSVHLYVGGALVLSGVYLAETAAAGDKMEEQEKQSA